MAPIRATLSASPKGLQITVGAIFFVADCGLLFCRVALPLLRAKYFVVRMKTAMKYSSLLAAVFYL